MTKESTQDRIPMSVGQTDTDSSRSSRKDGIVMAVPRARDKMPDILSSLTDDELKQIERRVIRKLDYRLLLPLALMYFANFLDRTQITTARVAGLQTDLHLRDDQYLAALCIAYAGYLCCQVPSNILVAKFQRPAFYLSCCMVIWGIISACTGIVHSYAGLLLCRFFLGTFEAAFYPGAVYILSCWYTRAELASRNSLFFSAQLFAGASAGLITAAITKGLKGVRGLESWRWLFILTGASTVVLAILALPFLPALPENTKFMNAQERAFAKWRLEIDAGQDGDASTDNKLSLAGLKLATRDTKVWVFSAIAFGFTSFGSTALVLPSIVRGLGFSAMTTEYLSAPPYVIAAIVAIVNAYWAGRSNQRYIHIIVPVLATLLSLVILATVSNIGVRYTAMCVMLAGNSAYPLVMTWLVNTIGRPASKRASALSVVSTLATINHIYNPFIFRDAYKPNYTVPTAIMAVFALGAIAAATVMRQMLVWENGRLDRGTALFADGVVQPVAVDSPGASRVEDKEATVTASVVSHSSSPDPSSLESAVDRSFRYII